MCAGGDIRYRTRPECDNLEVIGRNQPTAKGVSRQATRAINDEGLPLGGWRCSYRRKGTKTHPRMDGRYDLEEAAQTRPRQTRGMSGMDREGEVWAMLAAQPRGKRTDIRVRARPD